MNDSLLRPGEIGKIILDVEAINEEFDGGIPERVIYEDLKDVATEEEISRLVDRAIEIEIVKRLTPGLLVLGPGLELVREYREAKGELTDARLREIHEYTFDLHRRSERWKRDFILRCLKFRDRRVSDLQVGLTFIPLPLAPTPRVELHVVPGTPITKNDEKLRSYIASLKTRAPLIGPVGFINGSFEEAFEGDDYQAYAYDESTASANSYIRIFRNGSVEAVRAGFSRGGVPQLPMTYEREVIQTLHRVLSILEGMSIEPPLGVTLTLSGAQGCHIVGERGIVPGGRTIAHPRIQAPVVQIPNYEVGLDQVELARLMKETFDRVWRDAGYPNGSQNYDERGVWRVG